MECKKCAMERIRSCIPKIQLLCLLAVGVLECVLFSIGNLHEFFFYDMLHATILYPCVLFWLVTLVQVWGKRPRYGIKAAVAMMLWFLLVELQHRMNGMEPHTIGLFATVYLLTFPFAAVNGDAERKWGIKGMTLLFLGASMVLLLYTILLMTGKLLGFLQGSIFWDGARIRLAMHPNISSRVLMITIAFCLCGTQFAKKKWLKVVVLLLIVPLFAILALTNSRGVLVMTCAMLAGTVFFTIYKGSWKQFFSGAVVAAVLFVALFMTSKELFTWNGNRLIEKAQSQQMVAEAETELVPTMEEDGTIDKESSVLPMEDAARANLGGGSPQGSFQNDLGSLNGRTQIWSSVFHGVRQNPGILIWGIDDTSVFGLADHTHNAWLETLARLGLPGFVLSLVFTVQAIWSAVCLMWYPHVELDKKVIAMLAMSLMVTGMLEPFLFFTEDFAHFIDIIFFLCLGYMVQWRKTIHEKT